MQELSKKIYSTIIIILGISLALFLLVVYPLFCKIKISSEQLFWTRREIAFLKTKTTQTSVLKQTFKQLGPDLLRIQNVFVSETPVEFFQFLENLAEENGILLDISFSSQQSKEVAFFPFLSIQLSFKGSFGNCLKFLEQLEISSYLIQGENLSMRRIGEKELKGLKHQELSLGDADVSLLIKVFTDNEKN